MALTVETITTTALDILSRYGLGDLSMRRLARELDVQPSALYWHVKSKQELLVLLAERMSAEVSARCPASTDPLTVVIALRDVMLRFRDGAEIMLLGYSLSPVAVVPAALSPDRLGSASAGIMAHALGAVAIEQNRAMFDIDDAEAGERFVRISEQLLREVRAESECSG
ncbi:TetR family transcriptional regulator [Brevibacterium sanguinis]|uniref:TetR family transcriptional regulator n=2 Tax=Brevibacterium TaxID=1696 RepID=A0A366IKW5_9MICO|nr:MULTISPECIES: TetR family transcriptional regulator [Brevibacterium]RBP64153.1 TetR family transcriptional regulator [Brevibacterium sanguinis]RBP71555.1 TetR family transcriptional regulator [Brevibacterium celere]